MSLLLGLAIGIVLRAVFGTIRADICNANL